jgi:hypothetical protein
MQNSARGRQDRLNRRGKESLVAPAKLADVAEALGCIEFKLIDAVKAGSVSGVRDRNDDWWISSKRGAAPSSQQEKPLPNPEDFSDPKAAKAVRAMREALRVSGGRK